MRDKQWDILGLGCAAVDDLLYVDSFPRPDTKVQVRSRERQCGGLTVMALIAAARLGARCAYAGVLGHDEASQFIEMTLAQEGIDVSPAVRRADARPVLAVVIVDVERHTRTILFDVQGSVGADDAQPPAETIRAAHVLFVDHCGVAGQVRAAQIARAAGIPVVADIERADTPEYAQLLALADHLIIPDDFASTVTGAAHPADAARALWTGARRAVVVTCGAAGCWYLADGQPVQRQPAYPVQVMDTTGCGDVFHGAYAAALARGLDLRERVRLASAAAALKAAQAGGVRGIPDRSRVEAFLAGRQD